MTWKCLEEIKEGLYETLSAKVALFTSERKENEVPKTADQVKSHFRNEEIRPELVTSIEKEIDDVSFAKVSKLILHEHCYLYINIIDTTFGIYLVRFVFL